MEKSEREATRGEQTGEHMLENLPQGRGSPCHYYTFVSSSYKIIYFKLSCSFQLHWNPLTQANNISRLNY
jgi:hypothetical protein